VPELPVPLFPEHPIKDVINVTAIRRVSNSGSYFFSGSILIPAFYKYSDKHKSIKYFIAIIREFKIVVNGQCFSNLKNGLIRENTYKLIRVN